MVVDALRLVDERPRPLRRLQRCDLVERARRLREQVGVHVERDALARERDRPALSVVGHRRDGRRFVGGDVLVRERVADRRHQEVEEVLTEAVVRAEEEIGAVPTWDRGFELREVGLVRDREQRHPHVEWLQDSTMGGDAARPIVKLDLVLRLAHLQMPAK